MFDNVEYDGGPTVVPISRKTRR